MAHHHVFRIAGMSIEPILIFQLYSMISIRSDFGPNSEHISRSLGVNSKVKQICHYLRLKSYRFLCAESGEVCVCFEHTRCSVNYFRQFWPNIVVGDGESEIISFTHNSRDSSTEHILHNLRSHVCSECKRKEHSSFLWQFERKENWREKE